MIYRKSLVEMSELSPEIANQRLIEALQELEHERTRTQQLKEANLRQMQQLKEANLRQIQQTNCKLELNTLMTETYMGQLGKFTIRVPDDVTIKEENVRNISRFVTDYNNQPSSIERSRSILLKNSVHYLWRQILEEILQTCEDSRDSEQRTRIVYEWEIFDPRTGTRKYIDFSFTDGASAHLSWLRYRCGLELKVNPKLLSDGSNTASGTVNTLGQKQALSRSASCVYACLDANDWVVPSEGYQACTFYADARLFSVARVSVDANMVVTVDVTEPIELPGYRETTADTALVIIKHFMISQLDNLKGLVCSKPHAHMCVIRGSLDLADGSSMEETWESDIILGVGGFAVVYYCGAEEEVEERAIAVTTSDTESGSGGGGKKCDSSFSTVIKVASTKENNHKLLHELNILRELEGSYRDTPEINVSVPVCVAFLSNKNEKSGEMDVIALRLKPVGVGVPKYLRFMEPTAEIFTRLVRCMGPVLVRVLHAAHKIAITHRDVRPSNLLIVPSDDYIIAEIIQANGDIIKAPNAMRKIDLSTCGFVLNDWGEAKDKSRNKDKINDLKALVAALRNPINLLDLTRVSTVESTPSDSQDSISSSFSLPFIAKESVTQIENLANSCSYDELEKLLSSISFTEPGKTQTGSS